MNYLENDDFKINFEEFVKMRKSIKKPMTEYAQKLLLKKLHKHHIIVANYLLEKSIERSWQGVNYDWLDEGEKIMLNQQLEKLEQKRREIEMSENDIKKNKQSINEMTRNLVDILSI